MAFTSITSATICFVGGVVLRSPLVIGLGAAVSVLGNLTALLWRK